MTATHEVTNQPPPLAGYDASDDPALLEALHREGAGWAAPGIRQLGRLAGAADNQENGRLARNSAPTTAMATASTRWSSTQPGTS